LNLKTGPKSFTFGGRKRVGLRTSAQAQWVCNPIFLLLHLRVKTDAGHVSNDAHLSLEQPALLCQENDVLMPSARTKPDGSHLASTLSWGRRLARPDAFRVDVKVDALDQRLEQPCSLVRRRRTLRALLRSSAAFMTM